MNQRKAKQIRRSAKNNLFNWYLSLLEEDQQKDLTPQLALQNTPIVQYWSKYHEKYDPKTKTEYTSKQIHVSEHTYRWFIIRLKKQRFSSY